MSVSSRRLPPLALSLDIHVSPPLGVLHLLPSPSHPPTPPPQVGMKVPVYVSKNPDFRLPTDPSLPIVMVGPGTGLAPFRSFLKERTLSGKPFGPAALFFGCRRRDQDYLYGDLLEAWHREGVVHLVNAFSREGKEKVYVQHRLAQEADRVWKMLEEGGHFYVCGDASSMAGSVEKALLDIIATKVSATLRSGGAARHHRHQGERHVTLGRRCSLCLCSALL